MHPTELAQELLDQLGDVRLATMQPCLSQLILLSDLERIRRQGFSMLPRFRTEPGRGFSLSAPVVSSEGQTLAAVCVPLLTPIV